MLRIFVNLKRFDVPKALGGLCPVDDPVEWIGSVLEDSVERGLGSQADLQFVYLLPEGLVSPAVSDLRRMTPDERQNLAIGVQGLHWEDVEPGGNFGAYTASLPAKAALGLGASWSMIGHSEERRAKLQVMSAYDSRVEGDFKYQLRALEAVDRLIQREVKHALEAGLDVLLCVGETAQQRGEGDRQRVTQRLEGVLEAQILGALDGVQDLAAGREVVLAYEPVWAIGPGVSPPGQAYIAHASGYIKQLVRENLGFEPAVVYGGGLKLENAGMIAAIETIDGGLVALTRFTGDIGFDVSGLAEIAQAYRESARERGAA